MSNEDDAGRTQGNSELWQIVERAQGGDQAAFAQLYERYVGTVYRYLAWRTGGDRALAEDLTSDTFVRALRAIGSFQYQGRDPGGWFLTIARNLLRDHVKSARYRFEVATADMTVADRATEGPENQVLRTLTAAAAMGYVRELAVDQQECVVLRLVQGLSVAETAAVMGRSPSAVKTLLHRAVKRLAARLPGDSL